MGGQEDQDALMAGQSRLRGGAMQVQKVGGANKGIVGEREGAVKEVRRATCRDQRNRGGCGKYMGGEGPAQGEGCGPVGSQEGWL